MVRSPIIFAPVNDDLLFLTADQQIFLQRGQGFIGGELGTPISLFCIWRKDLDDDGWVSQHPLCLLSTTDRHIWMQVVVFSEFQPHITRVNDTQAVLWQSLVNQRGKASGEGRVGRAPTRHINKGFFQRDRRGWAQHENKAMPILIEAIGRVIKGEILLNGHVNRSIRKGCSVCYHGCATLSFHALLPVYHKVLRVVRLRWSERLRGAQRLRSTSRTASGLAAHAGGAGARRVGGAEWRPTGAL